jgi:hypothetical protein
VKKRSGGQGRTPPPAHPNPPAAVAAAAQDGEGGKEQQQLQIVSAVGEQRLQSLVPKRRNVLGWRTMKAMVIEVGEVQAKIASQGDVGAWRGLSWRACGRGWWR